MATMGRVFPISWLFVLARGAFIKEPKLELSIHKTEDIQDPLLRLSIHKSENSAEYLQEYSHSAEVLEILKEFSDAAIVFADISHKYQAPKYEEEGFDELLDKVLESEDGKSDYAAARNAARTMGKMWKSDAMKDWITFLNGKRSPAQLISDSKDYDKSADKLSDDIFTDLLADSWTDIHALLRDKDFNSMVDDFNEAGMAEGTLAEKAVPLSKKMQKMMLEIIPRATRVITRFTKKHKELNEKYKEEFFGEQITVEDDQDGYVRRYFN